jgi:hypothetical protein
MLTRLENFLSKSYLRWFVFIGVMLYGPFALMMTDWQLVGAWLASSMPSVTKSLAGWLTQFADYLRSLGQ